jgi:hypothetical protein
MIFGSAEHSYVRRRTAQRGVASKKKPDWEAWEALTGRICHERIGFQWIYYIVTIYFINWQIWGRNKRQIH